MYLTDEQYKQLLEKIFAGLDEVEEVIAHDCDDLGCKDTQCNVGLCNDLLTTKETAMFPDEFPERMDMKYRQQHQRCPLDNRTASEMDFSGCFWTCAVFQDGLRDIAKIKSRYARALYEFVDR